MTEVWLAAEPAWMFTTLQRMLIMDAVLHHGKRNGQDDSPVLVALQDADRVVNIGGDIAFRKGQFCGNALRVVDPVHLLSDPAANFKNPGSIAWTLHDDILCFGAEDGVASLRTPKGRAFAQRRLAAARAFLDEMLAQREEEGLIPFPTFD